MTGLSLVGTSDSRGFAQEVFFDEIQIKDICGARSHFLGKHDGDGGGSAFAGVTVNGASITQDKDGTRILYGRMIPSAQILKGQVKAPEGSHRFMAAVKKYGAEANVAEASARRTESQKTRTQNGTLSSREAKGAIEERLKSEPGLESKDIQVTLSTDAVKLSGSVVSADDRDKAVRIARS